MSLINQMLKDLDARHEDDVRAKLQREVRALPVAQSRTGLRIGLGVALALALGAAAWWSYATYLAPALANRPVAPAVSVPAPAPPSMVQHPAQPVAEPVVPVTQGQAVASAPQAPSPAPAEVSDTLKLSPSLDRVPEPAAPRATATPKSPLREEAPLPASPRRAAGTPVIEKTPVAKSAREQAEIDYRRAVSLVNGGRAAEAIDLLIDVLRQESSHVASRQLLARLLVEQRRLDEAMAILAEGLVSQPGQTAWAMTLARLQMERGDAAGAARTLRTSESFAAANADYQGFSGYVLHRLGKNRDAADHYRTATRIAPTEGRWWFGLGLSLEAEGSVAEAREAFLRARASGNLNPDLNVIVDQKLR